MGNAVILVQLLTQGLTQLQGYGALLAKAHSEGRDVTDAELDECVAADDIAKKRLQDLIDARKAVKP
jgi:hypothetical protein